MAVDYRLLPHFTASRARLESARLEVPQAWRCDVRPAAREAAERWVAVRAEARRHLELVRGALETPPVIP
jgi:hypothetical protein